MSFYETLLQLADGYTTIEVAKAQNQPVEQTAPAPDYQQYYSGTAAQQSYFDRIPKGLLYGSVALLFVGLYLKGAK